MEHLLGHPAPTLVAWDEILMLLLPLPIIAAANWQVQPPGGSTRRAEIARLAGMSIWVLLGLIAAGCVLLGLLTVLDLFAAPRSGAGQRGTLTYSTVLAVTGMAAGLVLFPATRQTLARVMPIDPQNAVHATAMVLSIVLVGSQLGSQLSVDVLSQQAANGAALGPLDLVVQEIPFLLLAALGVGLFVRRPPRAALERLGLVRPTGWQVLVAIGAAGLFYAFGNGVDMLSHTVTPGVADKVDAANQRLFGQLGSAAGIATIALAAGICEEVLFRGAMQPRLGVVWTSLVFAAIHTQYGLSLDAVAVFVLAAGLGLLRKAANTTTAAICHVVYNTIVGIGIAGTVLFPALVIEAALLLAGLAALLTGRLGSLRAAQ